MVNTNILFFEMMEGEQIGQYRLEKLLGVGGFGGVFRASEIVGDQVLRQLAIKVIPGTDDTKFAELIAATNLEHDHLIRTYTAGEYQFRNRKMLYLAMELAEESLEDSFQGQEFRTEEIYKILLEITKALVYLHEQKQVHRDLKPANILRIKDRWKLSDFGLIRKLDHHSYAKTANEMGTIVYMPPEAFDGKISFAWDMWSLGIMLVEMVTGTLPYKFEDENQLLKQVMNGFLQLPPLTTEFEPIILGCLQIERQKRWTAIETLEYLNRKILVNTPDDLFSLSQKLFEKGDQLCKENKLQEGIEYFNKAIGLNSSNVPALICRGYAFSALSQYTEAIQSFDKVLQIQPDLQYVVEAREKELELERQKYQDITNHLIKLLEKSPIDTSLLYNIGVNLFKLKKYEESVEYFEKCIKINSALLGTWIFLGLAFNMQNKYKEEEECYDRALNIFPNNIELLFRRGKALFNLNDYKKSIVDFNNLVLIDRENINAWLLRGIVLNELKHYEEALESYDFAISINPNISNIWYNKGTVLFNQGKYDESILAYQKALSLDSTSSSIWSSLGLAFYSICLYENALDAYNQAISLNFDISYLYEIGKILVKLKRYEDSMNCFDEILKYHPESTVVLFRKVEIYIEIGNAKLAIDCCNMALSINKEEAYTYYLLGDIFNLIKQFENAISFYTTALSLAPTFVQCWYKKGNLLFDTGQYQLAIESYNHVIELCPDFYALDMVMENRKRAFYALDGDIEVFITDEDEDEDADEFFARMQRY